MPGDCGCHACVRVQRRQCSAATLMYSYMRVYMWGDCFGFFNNETVLYQPSVHPCPPPVFASLLTFPRMKWRLAVPETGGRAAGLNTRRSQRYATALSEPLKLTGCQKTTLPMLRPPKLTLLWPISRNSIPSQSPDLRSPKRDNSSPWKKELDEDAQIVRGREEYLHFPAPDSVYSSAWQACRLSGDRGRCGEPRQTGAPPPSLPPLPVYLTVYCLSC